MYALILLVLVNGQPVLTAPAVLPGLSECMTAAERATVALGWECREVSTETIERMALHAAEI